jgi:hypothetical protein
MYRGTWGEVALRVSVTFWPMAAIISQDACLAVTMKTLPPPCPELSMLARNERP